MIEEHASLMAGWVATAFLGQRKLRAASEFGNA